jgi:hypothetical protein
MFLCCCFYEIGKDDVYWLVHGLKYSMIVLTPAAGKVRFFFGFGFSGKAGKPKAFYSGVAAAVAGMRLQGTEVLPIHSVIGYCDCRSGAGPRAKL